MFNKERTCSFSVPPHLRKSKRISLLSHNSRPSSGGMTILLLEIEKVFFKIIIIYLSLGRAVDPHSFFSDQDPAVFFNADPDLAVF